MDPLHPTSVQRAPDPTDAEDVADADGRAVELGKADGRAAELGDAVGEGGGGWVEEPLAAAGDASPANPHVSQ